MKYSLVVPYFRTPEITRLCLYSIFHFARGDAEVIVVDNAPGSPESAMLGEFNRIRVVDNVEAPTGSPGNFEALDLGLERASHELVGFVHSDTVFVKQGWDLECFGRLQRRDLAALGTLEREANPFRNPLQRARDWWHDLRHRDRPDAASGGKLMLHFLLTRKSTIAKCGFSFMGAYRHPGHVLVSHFQASGRPVEVLSARDASALLWHTSNITSLLTGQMDDPRALRRYRQKRRQLLGDARVRAAFGPVLPPE